MDKTKFKFTNSDGVLTEYEVVASVDIKGKSYLCYTDNTKDEDDKYKVYISGYKKNVDDKDSLELFPIEDEKEWELVTSYLNAKIQ